MPGLAARVHDAYVAGEGLLHASLLGLFTIANVRGTSTMAEGELMRDKLLPELDEDLLFAMEERGLG